MQKSVPLLLLCSLAGMAADAVPSRLYDALQWRNIGPFRGGRVAAAAGVPGDPVTFYFGSAGGGVWKTSDAGSTWAPVFDGQPVASIGALEVDPSNHAVVYAGTGETDIRSQIGFGDGIYKSSDAGKTWANIGLRETRQIAKILVDPRDSNRIFVAALGHVYGPNPERGVFRSTDGGRTWQKVLYTSPDVGAADIGWDPAAPDVIYATMWNARRPPWSVYGPTEGPGSGLWQSVDGGDHWTQLTGHGLPGAMWRRAGVAAAHGRVYVLVDAQGGGLFRSDDRGATWTRTSSDSRITSRGWYFNFITVDPKNPDVVYVPNVALYRSIDGGKTFTVLRGAPGGDDYHVLWVDPAEPRRMVCGTDQGATVSVNGGVSWTTWYNQPTAQMYHVITDNRFPYTVYGSQQDSGTAAVVSRTDHGVIDARDWFSVGGAESGYIAIDPKDQNIYYVGNTSGALSRFDRRTGQSQNITPWPLRSGAFGASLASQKHRYPWTAPLVFSASEPDTLYYASQYLMKTTDGGLTWKEISPDLTGDTRTDKAAATTTPTPANARALGYGVIYAIAPSPLKPGLIWVGSDNGLLNLTRDGGTHWENITPRGLPDWSRVTQIEASHFDPAEAYVTVDRHRMEDYKPYIYRTRDYGKSWTLAVQGLEAPAYLNGVREDPARRGLLYAATELGVAVSFDDGDRWQSLQLNLPAVSVRDLVVHASDLVIATHGRGFWILDNITPLRQADTRLAAAPAHLFKPAAAIRLNPEPFMGTPFPVDEPKAKNPPDGAVIDYFFAAQPQGDVTLEIADAKGEVIRRFSTNDTPQGAARRPQAIADSWMTQPARLASNAGLNRFVWDLRYAPPGGGGGGGEFGRPVAGPLVMPGTYQVRLTAGGRTYTEALSVNLDPRSTATTEDLTKQFELSMNCWRALADTPKLGSDPKGIANRLRSALAVAQSADRTPPAVAYTLYEEAMRDMK
jgi:photosystem II stability/assembly factor-like uncharacterized protein